MSLQLSLPLEDKVINSSSNFPFTYANCIYRKYKKCDTIALIMSYEAI